MPRERRTDHDQGALEAPQKRDVERGVRKASPADSPTPLLRVGGLAAAAGSVLWPVGLVDAASVALTTCGTPEGCQPDRGLLAPLAVAGVLLAVGVASLELRSPRPATLFDLIGDLSVGTSAALLVISTLVASFFLVWPAFLLCLIGSIIFGWVGRDGSRRSRTGSLLVAFGAGAILVFLALAGVLGIESVAGLQETTLMGFLMLSVGWAWLGLHLALARPLVARS